MFAFIHYPFFTIVFILILLLMFFMKLCPKRIGILSILSGFFSILLFFIGLFYSLPLEELFLFFLILTLSGFKLLAKEAHK